MIGSCLGDLYSVNFLENSDIPSMFHTETLDAQYMVLKNETSLSHVQKVSLSQHLDYPGYSRTVSNAYTLLFAACRTRMRVGLDHGVDPTLPRSECLMLLQPPVV